MARVYRNQVNFLIFRCQETTEEYPNCEIDDNKGLSTASAQSFACIYTFGCNIECAKKHHLLQIYIFTIDLIWWFQLKVMYVFQNENESSYTKRISNRFLSIRCVQMVKNLCLPTSPSANTECNQSFKSQIFSNL